MPWKESEVIPEGNGPVHQQKQIGSGQPTLEDFYQRMIEKLDKIQERLDSCIDRLDDKMRERDQPLARQEQDARQSRLAMEADGQASTRTRERLEGAATAAQACVGIAILHARLNLAQTTRPASA